MALGGNGGGVSDEVLFEDDFESGDFGTGGWTAVNDGTNDWIVGSASALTGTYSAYISSNGSTAIYNASVAQVSHVYIDVAIPDNINECAIEFDFQSSGEGGGGVDEFDFGRTFLTDTSFTPVAGTLPTVGASVREVGRSKYFITTTTSKAVCVLNPTDLAAVKNTTQRLIFTWTNDANSGTNPSFNIDNVRVVAGDLVGYTLMHFRVKTSFAGAQTLPAFGSVVDVEFNFIRDDVSNGIVYAGAVPTYPVERDGKYLIQCSLVANTGGSGNMLVGIFINGIEFMKNSTYRTGSGASYPFSGVEVSLKAGIDTVLIKANQDASSAGSVQNGASFSITYLGK